MAHKPQQIDVDPKALEEAQNFWHVFTEATKYGIVAIVIVLALMAIFLVN